MNVPDFIARQFYVSGSLRNTPDGFSLQAHNPFGDGKLVGLGSISVDGQKVEPEALFALREGQPGAIRATDLSGDNPIQVKKGDRVTLHVRGYGLTPGRHRLEVELYEQSIGRLRFSITDQLAGG